MNIQEYYRENPQIVTDQAYLERLFVETIFYPEFGDNGLDFLEYQKCIFHPYKSNKYFIDFVVQTNEKKFAIELDGQTYHTPKTTKEFDEERTRANEIIRQGYELIRYSYNQVKTESNSIRHELRSRIIFTKPELPDRVANFDDNKSFDARQSSKNSLNRNTHYIKKSENSNGCGKAILIFIAIIFIILIFNRNSSKKHVSPSNVYFASTSTSQTAIIPYTTPTSRLIESSTPLAYFTNHKLSIRIDQTVNLSYNTKRYNNIQFFIDPPNKGVIKTTVNSAKQKLSITGLGTGEVDIIIKNKESGEIYDRCHVSVRSDPILISTPTLVNKWGFSKSQINVKQNQTIKLDFSYPSGAIFQFSSTNDLVNISYINFNDYVSITGKSTGTCTINLIDLSTGKIVDSCKVTVTK